MRFRKMHGLGNDYVYVNCFEERVENPSELARIISNRHTGIGADGLILIGPSQTADLRMRIFNADGSEAEMCGNGIRCVGNPHAVFFCDNAALIDLAELGAAMERHSLFPRRTNVHFVQIDRPEEFTIRTWERGSGITMACGSGACASCVAAVLTGRRGRLSTAHLPGGDLELNWRQDDNCVYMTGPATEVFEGTWPDN